MISLAEMRKFINYLSGPRALLPLILMSGFAFRVIGLGRNGLWNDEMYAVAVSRLPMQDFIPAVSSWGHPPVYYLLGRVWFGLVSNEIWSRSLSVVAGVATIFIVYLLGKELFNRQVSLWAAALVAFSPFLIAYSRDATPYSWLTFLALLSLYFLTKSVVYSGWYNWLLYTLITAIVLFTHLLGVVLLLANTVFFFIIRIKKRRSVSMFLASQAILFVVLFGSWLLSRDAQGIINPRLFPWVITLKKVVLAPFFLLGGNFGGSVAMQPENDRFYFLAAAVLYVVAVVIVIVVRRTLTLRRELLPRRANALLLYASTLVVFPIMLHNIGSEGFQATSNRFFVWATPACLLWISVIIVALNSKAGKIIGTALLSGFVAIASWGILYIHDVDYRGSFQVISDNYQEGDVLMCFNFEPCWMMSGYYLPEDLRVMGGNVAGFGPRRINTHFMSDAEDLKENFASAGSNVDERKVASGVELQNRIREALTGIDRVWFLSFYTYDGSGYLSEDAMGTFAQGWREELWQLDDFTVYLYSRTG